MTRWIAALLLVTGFGTTQATAQSAGPRAAEIALIPGGWTYFTEAQDSGAPSFGNYGLGAGITFNINRIVGVEGEVVGAIGRTQNLTFRGVTADTESPHLLNYSGNLVVHVPTASAVLPYVTGGVGGLSIFERATLGINDTETFLTGNVGGGIKWYAGRWGLRGDYRFLAVRSKDDANEFFGRETRYGHRVYGGVLINLGY
jgi:opacity protein-like surface antigen